ncbi:MAG TPA: efflux RND transporter permease subunit [Verrucomicrobiae bacterium]|jgi:multidrug efflux pump subunit AcrB|nr:efflux RND transporter permease subunit [Verrucomicrobiae bacterium]
MWIVRLALRRPYTFVVLAILILILGTLSALRTPTDIFPNINIPVVSIIWNYTGLAPSDMASRIITLQERNLTTTVNDIEHLESQSLNGVAVIKVFFHPGANISTAIAQIAGQSQTQLKQLPPGTTPPLIITYSASSVPILQLALSSPTLSEQQLNDYGLNFIRPQLTSVPGAAIPYPYGGKQRQVQIDLNTAALQANGLSPLDVVNAISAQNLILPAGTAKIGAFEYNVDMNGSPTTIQGLNDLPIKTVGTSTIYIRDVAFVRDGFPPQTNIVRVDGRRSTLMTIQKIGNASTLDIIGGIKQLLPSVKNTLPQDLQIRTLGDQSVFVTGAVSGVVREALIAACLTAVMILLFLGSWRSTVIIAISIPLSILSSIIALSLLGETINIMTLGGLALAVGILVDDATVTIENIHRYLAEGKELEEAILDGAQQIAIPALVSTLSICIVFVPMFLLSGVARYLFVPLAEAVVFAMLASYLLSRTLVPTMAKYFLKAHAEGNAHETGVSKNLLVRFQAGFERGFENIRSAYRTLLETFIGHRRLFAGGFLLACVLSFALLPWLGQDFFPAVDSGDFTLHLRAPTGTRIEETAALCDRVENEIRKQIPAQEFAGVIDNIGLPYSGINLSYSNSAPVGTQDADIMVSLSPKHHPTAGYVHDLRLTLARDFPGVTFYFLPSDMVTQILNFGLPAPIDIQVVGNDLDANREFADKLLARVRSVSGTADLRIQQTFDQPKLHIDVDRTKAGAIGFTQREIATSLLVTLSGSAQTAPTFWLNPKNGVSYTIATQTPQYRVQSLQDLSNIPVTGTGNAPPSILANLASFSRVSDLSVVSHYNVAPVIDIFGSVQGRDLGGVSKDIFSVINASQKELPRGSKIIVRGQIQTMRSSFLGLLTGLVFAIVLVYLLIVMNFQSWLDPFIILMALPAALAGIVWFLFMTRTTISVPALTGSIMCVGVATANSILVVSFAKEQLSAGLSAAEAALQAGYMRFRPVLMTALAMIIGMAPMALGLGEGGEQNAPLGRAVIGGLLFATVSTLFFVPAVFAIIHGQRREGVHAGNQQ